MGVQEIEWDVSDWMDLIPDKEIGWAPGNTAANLRCLLNAGNFFTS
jgi:hypothetical protein